MAGSLRRDTENHHLPGSQHVAPRVKKSKSSARWLADHESDEYVKLARQHGYRSRASFKLLEINDKHNLLRRGAVVVDLGAAPGGWSQVVREKTGDSGLVIASDILDMEPLAGVRILQGDFTTTETLDELLSILDGRPVDLVISDMAPNLSGMKEIDQPRSTYLVELAIEFARTTLKKNGALLAKCFEGAEIEQIRADFRKSFNKVQNVKPKASRGKSREIYLLGQSFQR